MEKVSSKQNKKRSSTELLEANFFLFKPNALEIERKKWNPKKSKLDLF